MRAAGSRGALRPGQVVEEFEADGKNVTFRVIGKGDMKGCLSHINSLVGEKAYVAWQKPFTPKQEREWIEGEVKKLKGPSCVTLVAECEGRIIGCASVWKEPFHAKKHIAYIGIGLSSERGKGIGYILMKTLERIAMEHFGIAMLQLSVYGPNTPALNLYKKCGFREFGRLKDGCDYYGKRVDEIFMVKYL